MGIVNTPLIARQLDAPFAVILRPLKALSGFSGIVNVHQFLSHVNYLAGRLPDGQHVINLCENRYLFTVAFCAVALRQQINLLPPNKKPATQSRLIERYQACYVLHDDVDLANDVEAFNVNSVSFPDEASILEEVIPEIELNRLVAISFTSGSTGDSKPNPKTWQVVIESSKINASHMLADCRDSLLYQLATVPPQHMWGLETTVLLPLFESVCVADSKPLFPKDIYETLDVLPEPRIMVTTPVHLRALCASQMAFPTLQLILCATSPLSQDLAEQTERLFSAELREVYGCSEIGSMAIRNTVENSPWTLFTGIHMDISGDGCVAASTDYLPESIVLQDRIRMLDKRCFELRGRVADMVDIAGKRGSLLEINRVLMAFPGIVDGIVFMPESKQAVTRLAALVVLPNEVQCDELKKYLRQHLDNAFIPRPIFKVKQLPREENGKLPIKQLQAYYRQLVDAELT